MVAKQPREDTVHVRLGDSVTLRCAASGYPNPSISWYRVSGDHDGGDNDGGDHGDHVLGSGLSVHLVIGQHDAGEVVCSADNGVGPPVNTSFNIVPVCK